MGLQFFYVTLTLLYVWAQLLELKFSSNDCDKMSKARCLAVIGGMKLFFPGTGVYINKITMTNSIFAIIANWKFVYNIR